MCFVSQNDSDYAIPQVHNSSQNFIKKNIHLVI